MLHLSVNIFGADLDTVFALLRHVEDKIRTGDTAPESELYPTGSLHFVLSGEPVPAEPLDEGAVVVMASDYNENGVRVPAQTMGQIVADSKTQRTLVLADGQTVTLRAEDHLLTPALYDAYFDAHQEEFQHLQALVASYYGGKPEDLPPDTA